MLLVLRHRKTKGLDAGMKNRKFVIFVSLVIAAGIAAGHALALLPSLERHKLLNVVGLFYDLLGVVVLSEMVASSETWEKISVDMVAPFVAWLHTLFPLGALRGACLTRGPSSLVVSEFAIGFWGYALIPLALLNETVAFPQFRVLRNIESRWRRFGLLLLLSGVGLQLFAAIVGLETQ